VSAITSGCGPLRAALEREIAQRAEVRPGVFVKLTHLTVLDSKNDPFRQDTPARHRDGQWFAELIGDRTLHLRGCHYIALGRPKPGGTRYVNVDADWEWLQRAAKAARWLGYMGFEQITDERNSTPIIRIREEADPRPTISVGEVELYLPEDVTPRARLAGWQATQPFRLALFGEKTSLEPVLKPIADECSADLLLPTGEASDTMIHTLANAAAQDGRRLIVLYFSDCDPAGYQMGVSVAWKLRALQELHFNELEFELHQVALTVDQVRDAPERWGFELPSTPLKDTEKRADRWVDAYGIEQTEIDSIATLRPEILRELAREVIDPFYDRTLAHRARETRAEWERWAQEVLVDQLGSEALEQLRADAEAKLAGLEEQVDAINDQLYLDDLYGVALPSVPNPPGPEVHGVASDPPLINSDWTLREQARRLRAHKRYQE
jgi:hypothetical protein